VGQTVDLEGFFQILFRSDRVLDASGVLSRLCSDQPLVLADTSA
jgi:hypothetical protein